MYILLLIVFVLAYLIMWRVSIRLYEKHFDKVASDAAVQNIGIGCLTLDLFVVVVIYVSRSGV